MDVRSLGEILYPRNHGQFWFFYLLFDFCLRLSKTLCSVSEILSFESIYLLLKLYTWLSVVTVGVLGDTQLDLLDILFCQHRRGNDRKLVGLLPHFLFYKVINAQYNPTVATTPITSAHEAHKVSLQFLFVPRDLAMHYHTKNSQSDCIHYAENVRI